METCKNDMSHGRSCDLLFSNIKEDHCTSLVVYFTENFETEQVDIMRGLCVIASINDW